MRSLYILLSLLQATSVLAEPALPHYGEHKSLGVASCSSSLCHGSIERWQDSSVLQNEYITWSRSDKHARAFNVLLNERSKMMAKKLGMKEAPQQAALCLDCHAHNPPPARRDEKFHASDGVACEACHGGAERWIKSHVEPKATHEQNLADGLYPLDNDTARAKLCLSCHLGNEQKFVTHRMMAAGHPRMSFELDTFTQIAPAHFKIDADWQQRKGQWNGARAWAIGQAVAAQELLGLLQSPKRGRDGLFPELVLFDCHSCHHPMSDKRNSGARLGAGPGIMRLNDSSLLMLGRIARRVEADGGDGFAQQMARLHGAIANGKSGSDALEQARALQQMIGKLIVRINGQGFSGKELRDILTGLIDDGLNGQYSDYQGAEQSVMALQSLVDVMGRQGLLQTGAVRPGMKRLLALVANDEKYQAAEFSKALNELKLSVQKGAMK